ncbi:MAG TPA: DUF6755 family protein [Terriglobales bacterium]|jgi:hypothetical protein|nr:DUF6755 family protein [Terriglobales bacterium]
MTRQEQGTVLFSALLALVGVGVVVQLWLLSASVDAIFRDDTVTPLHAAIGSVLLFLINAALLLYLFAFDARTRRS